VDDDFSTDEDETRFNPNEKKTNNDVEESMDMWMTLMKKQWNEEKRND